MSIWHGPAPQQIGERAMGGEFLRRRRCNAALPLALEQAQLPRRIRWRSTPLSRATRPNPRKRPTASLRIGTRYWRSRLPGRALQTPADDQSH